MTNSTARNKLIAAQACMRGFDAAYNHLFAPVVNHGEQMEQACAMLHVVSNTLSDALMELLDVKTGSNLIPLFEKASARDRETVLRVLNERINKLAESWEG